MKTLLLLHPLKCQEFLIAFNSRFQLEASENKQANFFFLNQVHGLPQFHLGTQIKNPWLIGK